MLFKSSLYIKNTHESLCWGYHCVDNKFWLLITNKLDHCKTQNKSFIFKMIFLYQFSLIFLKCYWSNYLNDVKYNPLYSLSIWLQKNADVDGTVWIVVVVVLDIAKTVRPVITWLVNVTGIVMLVEKDTCARKVILIIQSSTLLIRFKLNIKVFDLLSPLVHLNARYNLIVIIFFYIASFPVITGTPSLKNILTYS